MIVRYTRQAVSDLDQISTHIAMERPGAAVRVGQRIRDSVASLADFPGRGRAGRVVTTRELVIPGLPYVVIYRVEAEFVDILTVRHAARRPWQGRDGEQS